MSHIPWLETASQPFPALDKALKNPNGLIAAGGDLSVDRLITAYRSGIFPWYETSQPVLWWSPDPRAVLFPTAIKVSRSLARRIRRKEFEVRLDQDFDAVIRACAADRDYAEGTWITTEMQSAYLQLHRLGIAHSIECYQSGLLVGGLYGVNLGRLFFGESMFHHVTDASKVAFVHLASLMTEYGCPLIDCQVENPHLTSLGCTTLPRTQFKRYLDEHADPKLDGTIPWTKIGPDIGNLS